MTRVGGLLSRQPAAGPMCAGSCHGEQLELDARQSVSDPIQKFTGWRDPDAVIRRNQDMVCDVHAECAVLCIAGPATQERLRPCRTEGKV